MKERCDLFDKGRCLLLPNANKPGKHLPCTDCDLQYGLEAPLQQTATQLKVQVTTPTINQEKSEPLHWTDVLQDRADRVALRLGVTGD